MLKFIIVLLVGLVMEAMGVALLSKGLKALGAAGASSPWDWLRLLGRGVTQPELVLGVVLECLFFGILIYLLAQRDMSLVWPLTSLGFVLTALMARFVLGEQVSGLRWAGVALIVAGATLVSWSEQRKGPSPAVETRPAGAEAPSSD